MASDDVTVSRAMGAGLLGTAAVIAAMAAARRLGITSLEFPRIIATAVADERRASEGFGWAAFVSAGAVFPLGYRAALRIAGQPASAGAGAALGLAHGLVAAGSAALLSPLHPRPRQAGLATRRRPRPPPRSLAVLVAVHVLYGAVLGAVARGADAEQTSEQTS